MLENRTDHQKMLKETHEAVACEGSSSANHHTNRTYVKHQQKSRRKHNSLLRPFARNARVAIVLGIHKYILHRQNISKIRIHDACAVQNDPFIILQGHIKRCNRVENMSFNPIYAYNVK